MTVVNLSATAGLPAGLDLTTGTLAFEEDTGSDPPGVRTLSELRPVLRDPAATGPELVYRLYRNVRRFEDEALLAAAGLRHDLTVTLPGRLGTECAKTFGHYHPPGGEGISFPELYQVVHGRAAFLLQRVDDVHAAAPRVLDVWVQVCEAGERILIPPDCGHVSVNLGDTPLVVADLVSVRSGHLYGSFQEFQGAAYYLLAEPGAEHGLRLEPNLAYGALPDPRVARGSRSAPVLADGGSAYARMHADPGQFAFLDALTPRSSRSLVELWTSAAT